MVLWGVYVLGWRGAVGVVIRWCLLFEMRGLYRARVKHVPGHVAALLGVLHLRGQPVGDDHAHHPRCIMLCSGWIVVSMYNQ